MALKTGADKGMVVSRGSIDDASTRDEACKILEGAKEAFQRRADLRFPADAVLTFLALDELLPTSYAAPLHSCKYRWLHARDLNHRSC